MIRQTERFIERFKAKASKARQVQSRVKMLDRIDMINDVIDENAKVNFRFTFDQQPGKVIAQLEDVSKAYGDLQILKKSNIAIERGDKIALIGANGRGKSTLLRIIAGTEPVEGECRMGYNVKTAMYAQHQLEVLNLDNTILEELKQSGTTRTETELRSILGCFLFSGEDVFKKIKVLSGGEKSRVSLALTLISASNFLLLDEPTNHLDMQSVNILIQALQQYEGSFVVISHDRHFVSHIATKIWYIEDHQIKEYPGTYDEYAYWMSQREKESEKTPSSEAKKASPVKNTPPPSQKEQEEAGRQLRKLRKQIDETEQSVASLEAQIKQLEEEMARPAVFADAYKLAQANTEYEKVKKRLQEANTTWEQLMLEAETLEARL
jgi:ATP-binding cassette subfamily F protein 3